MVDGDQRSLEDKDVALEIDRQSFLADLFGDVQETWPSA